MQVEKRKAENSGCAALFGAENNDIGPKKTHFWNLRLG